MTALPVVPTPTSVLPRGPTAGEDEVGGLNGAY